MNNYKYAIGLMSGTSLDGVDAALVKIAGQGKDTQLELIHFGSYPISEDLKEKIKLACDEEKSNNRLLCSLNFELGQVFAQAALSVCEDNHFPIEKIDFIASHGQTVYHLPNPGENECASTMQIGEAAVIAYQTNKTVVSNFRVMDMAAGGEGAPLVPYSEYVLYSQKDTVKLLQNIGGIGNVTVVSDNLDDMMAFDTGPGNMMIDEAMVQLFKRGYDKNGEVGATGDIYQPLLNELLDNHYFMMTPPKSTGRELFGKQYTTDILNRYHQIKPEDMIATLTYFTAKTIADAYKQFILTKHDVKQVIIGGGGAYNPTLVAFIQNELPGIEVCIQEDIGFSSDAKEAIAFVVLANETLHGMPSNVIASTNAKEYVVLGQITPAPRKDKQWERKKLTKIII